MKRISLIACGVAILSGCSTTAFSRASTYKQTVQHVTTADGSFRVYDHKSENSLLVGPNMGRILAMGAAQGATFGVADASPPEQQLEKAANQHLANTGRANCKVTKGYLLQKPLYEFWYECTDNGNRVGNG